MKKSPEHPPDSFFVRHPELSLLVILSEAPCHPEQSEGSSTRSPFRRKARPSGSSFANAQSYPPTVYFVLLTQNSYPAGNLPLPWPGWPCSLRPSFLLWRASRHPERSPRVILSKAKDLDRRRQPKAGHFLLIVALVQKCAPMICSIARINAIDGAHWPFNRGCAPPTCPGGTPRRGSRRTLLQMMM